MERFLKYRPDLASLISIDSKFGHHHRLLAVPTKDRLCRILVYLLDENEFLSPFGIRSLSKIHATKPYIFRADGHQYRVDYVPGEGNTHLFGGNSNWRGPVWFPINYLLVEALERYAHFYGSALTVECPTGSGKKLTLDAVARELSSRLSNLFLPNGNAGRPCHGGNASYAEDPNWRDLVLFHEYFHADTGRG